MDYAGYVWQMMRPDEWEFGIPIRGIVRNKVAFVYFNNDGGKSNWIWGVLDGSASRGKSAYLWDAISQAEEALGIDEMEPR